MVACRCYVLLLMHHDYDAGGIIVKNGFLAMVLAITFAMAAPVSNSLVTPGYSQVQAAEAVNNMGRLTLILKKLRDALGSMKDFDELEKAGLRKKDVDRMRKAMQDKISQMMEDAIYAIRAL